MASGSMKDINSIRYKKRINELLSVDKLSPTETRLLLSNAVLFVKNAEQNAENKRLIINVGKKFANMQSSQVGNNLKNKNITLNIVPLLNFVGKQGVKTKGVTKYQLLQGLSRTSLLLAKMAPKVENVVPIKSVNRKNAGKVADDLMDLYEKTGNSEKMSQVSRDIIELEANRKLDSTYSGMWQKSSVAAVSSVNRALQTMMLSANYAYCGPGTNMYQSLIINKTPPINELDEACMQHDISYLHFSTNEAKDDPNTPKRVRESDVKLISDLEKIGNENEYLKADSEKISTFMKVKLRAEDAGLMSPIFFLGPFVNEFTDEEKHERFVDIQKSAEWALAPGNIPRTEQTESLLDDIDKDLRVTDDLSEEEQQQKREELKEYFKQRKEERRKLGEEGEGAGAGAGAEPGASTRLGAEEEEKDDEDEDEDDSSSDGTIIGAGDRQSEKDIMQRMFDENEERKRKEKETTTTPLDLSQFMKALSTKLVGGAPLVGEGNLAPLVERNNGDDLIPDEEQQDENIFNYENFLWIDGPNSNIHRLPGVDYRGSTYSDNYLVKSREMNTRIRFDGPLSLQGEVKTEIKPSLSTLERITPKFIPGIHRTQAPILTSSLPFRFGRIQTMSDQPSFNGNINQNSQFTRLYNSDLINGNIRV